MLFATPTQAQWRTTTGYNDLITELGGSAPATDYAGVSYLPAESTAWRVRKGYSNPAIGWQLLGFSEDGTWFGAPSGTPIGYGDGDDNSVLGDMRSPPSSPGYTSIYLRHTFTIPAGQIPDRLLLRIYVDDGAIVWINGHEIERFHVTPGFKSFNSTAQVHEAEWESFDIVDPSSVLVEGTNIIAIHALNQHVSSSDFSIDAELVSPALRVSHVEASQKVDINPSEEVEDFEYYFLPEKSPDLTPTKGYAYGGSAELGGKIFHIQSVTGNIHFLRSSHADNVANRFYSSNSLSTGVSLIDNFGASGWMNSDGLRSNFSLLPPRSEDNHVQNHSWIRREGDASIAAINDIVRRQDFAIDRDDFICAVGLNNDSGTSVPPGFGGGYNVISVGRTDGNHSRGGTTASFDGPGRVKPEIVADDSATSYSTPQVGSAAALLIANARSRGDGWGKSYVSYVMKAILLAGATKSEFQTGSYTWSRTTTQPLDAIYGAGELNVQHSYHILDAGEQSTASTAGDHGWDQSTLGFGGSAVYTIVLDQPTSELSCIIAWNRIINSESWLDGGAFNATVANMSLQLHRVDGGVPTLYDSSDSAVDNVEHVYLRNLAPGTYTLTVDTDVAVDFGIAWRAEQGELPKLTVAEGAVSGDAEFAFSNLAVGKSYTLLSSTDLATWTPEHTFPATADSDSHTLPTGFGPTENYFRLSWDPVN